MLQREYHCYNSARLEAAVEALERGLRIEEVPIREFYPYLSWVEGALGMGGQKSSWFSASRLCLDLLNEELEQRIEAQSLL